MRSCGGTDRVDSPGTPGFLKGHESLTCLLFQRGRGKALLTSGLNFVWQLKRFDGFFETVGIAIFVIQLQNYCGYMGNVILQHIYLLFVVKIKCGLNLLLQKNLPIF